MHCLCAPFTCQPSSVILQCVQQKKMEDDFQIINLEKLPYYPLKEHECFFNWTDKTFDEVAAKRRIENNKCAKNCDDQKECEYCSFDGDWRSAADPKLFLEKDDDDAVKHEGLLHWFVTKNGEMVFLEAFAGEDEKAERRLEYLISVVESNGNGGVKYLDGYKYICKTLQAFVNFCNSSLTRSDIELLPKFKDLDEQAQIGVLSVKFVFNKESKNTFRTQIRILQTLTELDPENPVWHMTLGIRLRLIKNMSSNNGRAKPPNVDESTCFETAYNLRPDVPQFFAALARNIAETLKGRRLTADDEAVSVNVEGQTIETVSDALDFLKEYTRLLLEAADTITLKDDIASTLTTMAEVFSASLPKQLQDIDLAEECITTAVRMSPTCSKANHRMGLFQWSKRDNDFDNALKYLTAAVACKNDNYFAVIDWIELMIHKADESSDILAELFDELLSASFSWTREQSARLFFLKGCSLFVTNGKKKDTMDNWIRAYETFSTSHFQVVVREASRFRWKEFDKTEILKLLTSSKRRALPPVKKMIYEVRKLIPRKVVEKPNDV